ncbi:DNA replication licensing factor MCM [Salix suchowensis]|nr:DNA replication licensing factor MCM [Salix suchowensis]
MPDVIEAVNLFKISTVEAAQAETQIKRRVGIGMRISERKLIDELARMGMNESVVQIANLFQCRQDFFNKSLVEKLIAEQYKAIARQQV